MSAARAPTGFVAFCRCGKKVAALDFDRDHYAARRVMQWLAQGRAVHPIHGSDFRVVLEACACGEEAAETSPPVRMTVEEAEKAQATIVSLCQRVEHLERTRALVDEANERAIAEASAWRTLFSEVARELGCLPSAIPSANAHVLRVARGAMADAIEIDGHKIHPAQVLRRIIRNATPRRGLPLWSAVEDLTSHGSTVSAGLCAWAGRDPHSGEALSEDRKGPAR